MSGHGTIRCCLTVKYVRESGVAGGMVRSVIIVPLPVGEQGEWVSRSAGAAIITCQPPSAGLNDVPGRLVRNGKEGAEKACRDVENENTAITF